MGAALLVGMVIFSATPARAQDTTAAEPPAAPSTDAVPPSATPAEPAATPEPTAAPAPDAATPAAASLTLIRIDVEDGFALHPWIYREERINDSWGILFDAHAQAPGRNPRFPPFAELDVGPVLHVGGLQINPQLGVDFTYKDGPVGGHGRFGDVIAQLYLIYSEGRVNAESWNLYFFPLTKTGGSFDSQFFLTRQLVTMKVLGDFAVGPHFEAAWFKGSGIDRLAYGGDLGYGGDWGQLTLFLADAEVTVYPADAGPDGRKQYRLESRLTFIRAF